MCVCVCLRVCVCVCVFARVCVFAGPHLSVPSVHQLKGGKGADINPLEFKTHTFLMWADMTQSESTAYVSIPLTSR